MKVRPPNPYEDARKLLVQTIGPAVEALGLDPQSIVQLYAHIGCLSILAAESCLTHAAKPGKEESVRDQFHKYMEEVFELCAPKVHGARLQAIEEED